MHAAPLFGCLSGSNDDIGVELYAGQLVIPTLIILGECNALLASGSDPTCHAECVKNTYKSLQPT